MLPKIREALKEVINGTNERSNRRSPAGENFSPEVNEECLFLLLLKTFMESENGPDNVQANANNRKWLDRDKENIVGAKQDVNYLKTTITEDNGEEAVGGAVEDADAKFMNEMFLKIKL